MLRRVQKYIRDHELLPAGGKVLICVSGGADSVALLDVLHRSGYVCHVAHCNFHLRGDESDRDEQAVRNLCIHMDVPLSLAHFDTISYAREHTCSIEVAARELRYDWFATLAGQQYCDAIAVAHHMNDQAETLILNLKRGAGIRGLGGMRVKASNPVAPDSVPVIRPLLCTTRAYIEHYLRDIRHIPYVVDSTNADTNIRRNAIRSILCSMSEAEIRHMAETAERMQGYADMLDGIDSREARLSKLYEELRTYNFTEIEDIYESLQRGEGGKTFTSPTHRATIRKRKLCITTV